MVYFLLLKPSPFDVSNTMLYQTFLFMVPLVILLYQNSCLLCFVPCIRSAALIFLLLTVNLVTTV